MRRLSCVHDEGAGGVCVCAHAINPCPIILIVGASQVKSSHKLLPGVLETFGTRHRERQSAAIQRAQWLALCVVYVYEQAVSANDLAWANSASLELASRRPS